MIEPTFTSMQVMEILADDGIKACRERITKLADDLFGREPKARGEYGGSPYRRCLSFGRRST